MIKGLFLIFNILIINYLIAQKSGLDNVESIISDRLEFMATSTDREGVDYTNVTERLTYYYNNPISLNDKCQNSLIELQLLTPIQINDVMMHIKKYGVVRSIEELQQIESMSTHDILVIAPFIETKSSTSTDLNSIDNSFKHHLRVRYKEQIQDSRAYKTNKYIGPKYGLYARYHVQYKNALNIGATLEKDAGESLQQKKQISDFQSAFIEYRSNRNLKKLIVGDYKASFGQGLTFSNNGGISKSSEVLLIGNSLDNLSPYRSVNESGFLRGLATEIDVGRITTRTFLSSVQQDATLSNTSSGPVYSSIYTSGLHRTETELSKINALKIQTIGLSSTYKLKNGEIGIISVHRKSSISGEIHTELHNYHLNPKRKNSVNGMYVRYIKNNLSAFSEISQTHTKGSASLVGFLFMPDKYVGLALLCRKYSHDFLGISSNSFSEKNLIQNEEGIYSAIKIDLPKRLIFSAFADVFLFSHPIFQSNVGGHGNDYFVELKRKSRKNREWLIQLKWKEKPKDIIVNESALKSHSTEITKKIRLQYQCLLNESLRFRSRIEFSEYLFNEEAEQGILMFQEIKYSELGVRWSVLCRYTLFDTEGYQSRIYTYEQNVQGAYSIPSFSGKGSKIMALFSWKLKRGLKISLKIGQLIYHDRDTIGNGLDEIEGQEKTELTTQIDFTF